MTIQVYAVFFNKQLLEVYAQHGEALNHQYRINMMFGDGAATIKQMTAQ